MSGMPRKAPAGRKARVWSSALTAVACAAAFLAGWVAVDLPDGHPLPAPATAAPVHPTRVVRWPVLPTPTLPPMARPTPIPVALGCPYDRWALQSERCARAAREAVPPYDYGMGVGR
jgi:hypothetical protein